jgi:hypothetical protein
MGRVRWVWIVTMVVLAWAGCLRLGYDKPREDGNGSSSDAPLVDALRVDAMPQADGPPADNLALDVGPTTGWVVSAHNLTNATLRGVWTHSPSQVYVVGDGGTVLFYDGSSWSKLTTPQLTADLHAVCGAQTNTSGQLGVYMVGESPYVWRLQDNSWVDPLQVPTSVSLFDVWGGASLANFRAVGAKATVLQGMLPDLLVQLTHDCTTGSLRTVIGGGSKIWIAGDGGKVCYQKGGIQELAHNKTTETLNAAWYDSSSGSIWFVGNNGTVLHVDSGGASSLIAAPVKGNLRGIWGSSGSDIWAVGGNGLIQHYDGATWSEVPSPTSEVLHDVWGSSSGNVWAVGMGGTVIRYLGGME